MSSCYSTAGSSSHVSWSSRRCLRFWRDSATVQVMRSKRIWSIFPCASNSRRVSHMRSASSSAIRRRTWRASSRTRDATSLARAIGRSTRTRRRRALSSSDIRTARSVFVRVWGAARRWRSFWKRSNADGNPAVLLQKNIRRSLTWEK